MLRRFVMGFYDALVFFVIALFILVLYPSSFTFMSPALIAAHMLLSYGCVLGARLLLRVYGQIWRYAGPKEYMRLVIADIGALAVFLMLREPLLGQWVTAVRATSLFTLDLLCCIVVRLMYQRVYMARREKSLWVRLSLAGLRLLMGVRFPEEAPVNARVKIAIVGAGNVGVMLADELLQNPRATYEPACFVDIDKEKAGREIYGVPVLPGGDRLAEQLSAHQVQEVVFALPNISSERRVELYKVYEGYGYKIKAYDYPTLEEGGKRHIRDFAVEDLLFRTKAELLGEETASWYRGKCVLITGGGGSIGSELARQIARCEPARLVILDVYENGAYDIQQELKMRYGEALKLYVEIASICDRDSIDRIMLEHRPDIVLHAAAHKHVPLMERNVVEAVENNVFGTLNVVEASEKYGVARFIMISTDKAVNPTNVMGATKRLCEMIVLSRSGEKTGFSATRFGNVLGSNGSVIPLFRRQIAAGGPVTITDKRIVRYFMTIPEASQLVMASGAMAKNGDLYVLDMGKPVRILELAENMIRLSGMEPYRDIQIVETGLRPGEKLYEELLIRSEELDKTDNDMIFVERDVPLGREEIERKLEILRAALRTKDDGAVRTALMQVVPTFHTPEEVNRKAIEAREMQQAAEA